ncbi:MAG: hypothetical protein LBC89_01010 [Bacteroidales bacterium]|jgi:hypothetical protein|nr:hypothetical protein [Bacteroidales bacterium]
MTIFNAFTLQLNKTSWKEQICLLASSWIEKGTKFKEFNIIENKLINKFKTSSWIEKGTKLKEFNIAAKKRVKIQTKMYLIILLTSAKR